MLNKFLRCIAVFCFAMCVVIMITGKSAIHEIEALMYGLIAVVSMIGEAVLSRIGAIEPEMSIEASSQSGKTDISASQYRYETAQAYRAALEGILANAKSSSNGNEASQLQLQAISILEWMKEDFPSHYAEFGKDLGAKIKSVSNH